MVLFDIQEEKLKPAVADLTAKSISAGYQVINVTLEADWTAAVKGVVDTYGRVDILVQAAGITGKTGIKTHEVDPANFDLVLGEWWSCSCCCCCYCGRADHVVAYHSPLPCPALCPPCLSALQP